MEAAAAESGAEPPGRREAATLPGPSRDTGQRDKKRTSREMPVEKRGPYLMSKAPSIQDKLQKHREMAKAMLRRKGGAFSGAVRHQPKLPAKRSVKFNKGYAALSQISDETLVSLDSDSDEELESRCSSGYSSAEASLVHGLLLTGLEIDLQVVGSTRISAASCCRMGIASMKSQMTRTLTSSLPSLCHPHHVPAALGSLPPAPSSKGPKGRTAQHRPRTQHFLPFRHPKAQQRQWSLAPSLDQAGRVQEEGASVAGNAGCTIALLALVQAPNSLLSSSLWCTYKTVQWKPLEDSEPAGSLAWENVWRKMQMGEEGRARITP